MVKEILQTIRYFSLFNYDPTSEEIYTFLKKKCSKRHLARILEKMNKKSIMTVYGKNYQSISNFKFQIKNCLRHTPPQYSISQKKINNLRFRLYIRLLSLFPQIKLVGLSGTVAMMNAEEKDDIDLFIITARNRLFTGRFITVLLANLLGIKRPAFAKASAGKDKVCLNLFFDEKNLSVPKRKQTEYVGHEVLQMKPLVAKGDIYQRFLEANHWVFRIFPNSRSRIFKFPHFAKASRGEQILNWVGDWIELLMQKLQLYFINRHRTSEIITSSQLWFHPEDFEKKILTKHKSDIQ